MRISVNSFVLLLTTIGLMLGFGSCSEQASQSVNGKSAAELLGDPSVRAICYSGYRKTSRKWEPSIAEIKEDLKLLEALGIRFIRTYQSKEFPHSANILQAIREIQQEQPDFEMYLMLGAWIQCDSSWTERPNHSLGDTVSNRSEIEAAIQLALTYPDLVKVIAVGNESMVHWAASYHVAPGIVLKWVKYLQELKQKGTLPTELWITSSDNFASWGGGDSSYHNEDLNELIRSVDYISLHTYPFHDTHYQSDYWQSSEPDSGSPAQLIHAAMQRALDHAKAQYKSTQAYVNSLGVNKPIHIGETGWASVSGGFYGPGGSRAADELKQQIYHQKMREWTDSNRISCFYFEAFDEPWKDDQDPMGSENHFGLFTVDGQAKYLLWDQVDAALFQGLTRGGEPIRKSYEGNIDLLMNDVGVPPQRNLKDSL